MREDDSALVDVEDYAIYGQGSRHCGHGMVEENLIHSKASGVRNALATKARGFRTR
uniref:Uncharacterized protein n=1 Tax=Rhizophora mucronata TaxID=61149 RepID=A0A2P2P282_RHIMU